MVITDDDYPMQSSTGTLTVRVCTCDHEGNMELCKPEALSSSPGLSTGALVAILLCAIILLCKYDWICKQMYILYLYIIVVPYHTISYHLSPSPKWRAEEFSVTLFTGTLRDFIRTLRLRAGANKNHLQFWCRHNSFPRRHRSLSLQENS